MRSCVLITQEGSTALHFAVASRQNELLEGLLSAGCPVDARDNAENTPLHVAAGTSFTDTIAALLSCGWICPEPFTGRSLLELHRHPLIDYPAVVSRDVFSELIADAQDDSTLAE